MKAQAIVVQSPYAEADDEYRGLVGRPGESLKTVGKMTWPLKFTKSLRYSE